MKTRRQFLSGAAAVGAALPIAGAHAAGLNGGFGGVLFQSLSSAITTAVGIHAAQAGVYFAGPNGAISNAVAPDGSLRGALNPIIGANGQSSSVFANILAYLTPHGPPTEPQILFSGVDLQNTSVMFEITIYPGGALGGAPATRIDGAGNSNQLTDLMYMIVKAVGAVRGVLAISSWVVPIEVWPIGIPMLFDMAVNGVTDLGYGLSVNQYIHGNPAGYPIVKTVRFGFSNAARPTGPINQNVRQTAIPWGANTGLGGSAGQLALNVGGNVFAEGTGLTNTSLYGFGFESNYAGSQISTAARLWNPNTGAFITPNLGIGNRLANTFGFGYPAAPVALFGGSATPSDGEFYFGFNGGAPADFNPPQGPSVDTLTEDITNIFSSQ